MIQVLKRTLIAGAAIALLATPAIASAEATPSASPNSSTTARQDAAAARKQLEAIEKQRRADIAKANQEARDKAKTLVDGLRADLKKRADERKAAATAKVKADLAKLKARLDAKQKKVCENRISKINEIITATNKRYNSTLTRIDQASTSIQTYNADNKLTVPNYVNLVALVEASKAVAKTSIDSQTAISAVNCGSAQPRADIADFKDKRAVSHDALVTYRDAVRALIKAVKGAAS